MTTTQKASAFHELGNGVVTTYRYDRQTFTLIG
jgi:hypothetical protein